MVNESAKSPFIDEAFDRESFGPSQKYWGIGLWASWASFHQNFSFWIQLYGRPEPENPQKSH